MVSISSESCCINLALASMSSQLPDSTRSRLPLNSGSSGQSFVYPIKSLLTGKIQPSISHQRSSPDPSRAANLPIHGESPTKSGGSQLKDGQYPVHGEEGRNTVSSSPLQSSMTSSRPQRPIQSLSHSQPPGRQISTSPNFRHFPAEQHTSDRSRSFSALISGPASPPLSSIATIVVGSGGVTSDSLSPSSSSRDNPPPSHSTSTNASEVSSPQLEFVNPDLLFNPSEYGIVHLAPVPASPSSTVNKLSPSDLGHSLGGSAKSSYKCKSSSDRPRHPSRTAGPSSLFSESLNSTSSSSFSRPVSESQPKSFDSACSAEPPITFRFQHAEDEYGNHVVIGREGKLERCEDEVGKSLLVFAYGSSYACSQLAHLVQFKLLVSLSWLRN